VLNKAVGTIYPACLEVLAAFDRLTMEIPIMRRVKYWRLSAFAAALVTSLSAAPASALTKVTTGGVIATQSSSETTASTTISVPWVNLYSTTIEVPNDKFAYLRARFTAESLCFGGPGFCRVRILYGIPGAAPKELEPANGNNYAFDSTDNGSKPAINSMQGHALERTSRESLPPGNYQVTVQYSVSTNAAINFTLDKWHLALDLLEQ
jgi:hypothetical protein